ncbi:MAG TPA: Gfo/Idh/MocA family oxidoreductase [Planctomycetota bacterium]|jgi:predicted dehydrogenase|nr:Gfo/Idh/MocA family oxidoreductase [Planctomycetota bacterium]OQC19325.1 MAG: 1,5-anhydro-D-fructose reductase [Planctomycetes bacterium ADurb.Bin069]NMD36957.1 Gfo/Idh/MocA family oxidoreductase [Planctomycetota bacterium]HNS00415.1 Gfo/Idh/MocA family oxidoreductase [Planctomycetota bacterium]HNU26980.1 Gfo/Idh/MocA family oxidoreductase [Planctomycetota bacterium]
MNRTLQRRRFLKQAGAFAGAAVLPAAAVSGAQANSAVALGLIGCGGRGLWIGDIFTGKTNARITAVHDLFDDRLDRAAQRFKVPDGKRFKGLEAYKDLVAAGIEGVLIESPPYCHPEQGLAAVEAGVNVFMAKPVAVDVPGCALVARGAALAKGKASYFVDFQTRAHDLYREAVKRVREGAIGAPVCGQVYYHAGRLGRQALPGASAAENRMREWVFDKALSGDIIVEQNIHVLDVCNWILDARPLAAYGVGGRKARVDAGDCWDHFIVAYQYPNDVKIDFSSNQFAKGYNDLCARVYGTSGTIDTHYDGTVTITGDHAWQGGSTQGLYYSGALTNARTFIESIESGKFINNGEEAAQSTQTCVLGRTAAYRRKELTWDEVQAENEKLDLKLGE